MSDPARNHAWRCSNRISGCPSFDSARFGSEHQRPAVSALRESWRLRWMTGPGRTETDGPPSHIVKGCPTPAPDQLSTPSPVPPEGRRRTSLAGGNRERNWRGLPTRRVMGIRSAIFVRVASRKRSARAPRPRGACFGVEPRRSCGADGRDEPALGGR